MDYALFPSSLGWLGIAGSASGIVCVILPAESRDMILERLCERLKSPLCEMRERDPSTFGSLPSRLATYMRGEEISFHDPIDRTGWTPFRSRVWDATRQIPYGETRSYSWVAGAIGQPRACRAVGQALHHNPVPILVPCHRVIGADKALTGFGGGVALKQQLISLETESTIDLK